MAKRQGSDKQLARSPSPVEDPAVRHSTFYMENEMVILRVSNSGRSTHARETITDGSVQVENTLFRVHRNFLERDSAFFEDFFRHARVHGVGATDSSAVCLPDVSTTAPPLTCLPAAIV